MNAQIRIKLAAGAAILGLFLASLAAFLTVKTAMAESAFSNDPVIENPGLLPTNPFYFLKRFKRLTQRAITVGPMKKADLELDILNQKAAELKRLLEISSDDRDMVLSAADLYEESTGRLQSHLGSIKNGVDRQSLNSLLTKLLDTAFKHFSLFADLETKKEILVLEQLERLQNHLAAVAADAFSRLDNESQFSDRLEKILDDFRKGDTSSLVLSSETIDRLLEKSDVSSWLAKALLEEEENLLLEIEIRLESDYFSSSLAGLFDELPGNPFWHVRLIDRLRESAANSDFKNQLAIIRQRLLDELKDNRMLGKNDAEKTLQEARRLAAELSRQLESPAVRSNAVNALSARAKFNLTQAEESFKNGQYGEAFGQGTAALMAAQNGLLQFSRFNQKSGRADVKDQSGQLKNEYDNLTNVIKDSGLDGENAPRIFELLAASEKAVAKVSDSSSEKSVNQDKLNAALRDAKTALFRARQELRNVVRQIDETTASKRASRPLIERVLPNQQKEKEFKKQAVEELRRGN